MWAPSPETAAARPSPLMLHSAHHKQKHSYSSVRKMLISYAHLIAQLAKNGLVGALVPQQQRHVPDVGHIMDVEAVVGGHVAELGQLRLGAVLQGLRSKNGLWSRLTR